MNRKEFSTLTKQQALIRQKNRCGSCGEKIESLKKEGRFFHKYGESAHAHHMLACQLGGGNDLSNCVILCSSCHYTVHNGGEYQNTEEYLISEPSDYFYFYG